MIVINILGGTTADRQTSPYEMILTRTGPRTLTSSIPEGILNRWLRIGFTMAPERDGLSISFDISCTLTACLAAFSFLLNDLKGCGLILVKQNGKHDHITPCDPLLQNQIK